MNEKGRDAGGSSREKPWERSWTTDEMRQNAHSWNLAGDSGLLKHLQDLSQTVLARTHATEKALDSLVEEINTSASEISNTNNEFLCLANTQFVENRVYDDDEKDTPQDVPSPDKKSKEEVEAVMLKKVREALSMSVAVLDTMFEPVEIQASDSEGEPEDEKSRSKTLILEPHNPYMHRPLPHHIGSEAFMADDRIGLGDSPSDSEEYPLKQGLEYDMEVSSESDIDFTPVGAKKRSRHLDSLSSSVSAHSSHPDELGQHAKKTRPVVDDLNDEAVEEQFGAVVSQSHQSNDFAAQLAAKLGKIAPPPNSLKPTMDKGSDERKTAPDDLFGSHQSDEDDSLFARDAGLFSGPSKLFDDIEDTKKSFWGSEPIPRDKNSISENEKVNEISGFSSKSHSVVDDLFSQTLSDEDDLFSTKPLKSVSQSSQSQASNPKSSSTSNQPQLNKSELRPGVVTSTPERSFQEGIQDERTTNAGYISDTGIKPSGLAENSEPDSRKPAGGVPMFGQSSVLDGLKAKLPRRPSSSSSESSVQEPSENISSASQSLVSSVTDQLRDKSSDKNFQTSHTAVQNGSKQEFSSPALTSSRMMHDNGLISRASLQAVASNSAAYKQVGDYGTKNSSVSQTDKPVSGGLFAEVNDEEDDLFTVSSEKRNANEKEVASHSRSVIKNIENQESAASVGSLSQGGKVIQQETKNSTSAVDSLKVKEVESRKSDIYSTVPPPIKSENKVKKPLSLFDDSDSGEDELLFSSASSAGSRRSQASSDLLTGSAAFTVEKKPLSKKGLFDDDDALFGHIQNDPDIDIFSGSSKPTAEIKPPVDSAKPVTILRSVEEDLTIQDGNISTTQSNFGKSLENSYENTPGRTQKSENPKSVLKNILFAESDNEEDDLFSSRSYTAPTISKSSSGSENVPKSFKNSQEPPLNQLLPPTSSASNAQLPSRLIQDQTPEAPPSRPSKPSLVFLKEDAEKRDQSIVSSDKLVNEEKTKEPKNIEGDLKQKIANVEKHKKPEPPRTLNIRKETDPSVGFLLKSDDDGDLFNAPVKVDQISSDASLKASIKPLVHSRSNIAPATEESLQIDGNQPTKITLEKKESVHSEVDGSSVSVSKLKESLLGGGLKIDPRALLPGRIPPLRQTPPKEETMEPSKVTETDGSLKFLLDQQPESEPVRSDQPVGFDQPAFNSSTLPSANKTRAKLGVRRRPPSNKARREAARASQNLDQSDKESPSSSDVLSPEAAEVNAVNSNVTSCNSILSPSTDEDDLFGIPQDLPPEYGDQNLLSTDLFSGTSMISPLTPSDQLGRESLFQSGKQKNLFENDPGKHQGVLKKETKPLFQPSDEPTSDLLFASEQIAVPPNQHNPQEISKSEAFSKEELFTSKVIHSETLTTSGTGNATNAQKFSSDACGTPALIISSNRDPKNDVSAVNFASNNERKKVLKMGVKSATELKKDDAIMPGKVKGESPPSDPLNRIEPKSETDENSLFEKDKSVEDTDHSSLFPFVKKKPQSKSPSNQPLFSQTPTLPSKSDKSVLKADFGTLEDEDSDLFPTSKKVPSDKSTERISNHVKGKDVKTWKFLDDDDDDIFLSGAKKGQVKGPPLEPKSFASGSEKASHLVDQNVEVPVKTQSSVPSSKNGFFSDENDDDDDLFTKPASQVFRSKLKDAPKSSLFDDEEDDLFGSSSLSTIKKVSQKNRSKEASASTAISSKVVKENVFEDPLKALQNDD